MSNFAPAVGHAVRLIRVLAEEPQAIGVSEISRKMGLNKNMVFRILQSLEEEGWVFCGEGAKYRLSLLPFQITSRAVERMPLSVAAAPYLQHLWEKFGESTYLGVRRNREVLYLQHLDSIKPVKVAGAVGRSYPLHCTAPGKVLLAWESAEFQKEFWQLDLKQYTEHTITAPELLAAELDKVRSQGFAIDNEEYGRGIVCIAAPIFDFTQAVVGAIGCSFSTVEQEANSLYQACGKELLSASASISSLMGFLPEADKSE